jgi:hypothetical protein
MHAPLPDIFPRPGDADHPRAGQLIGRLSAVMLGGVALLIFSIGAAQSQVLPSLPFSFDASSGHESESTASDEPSDPILADLASHPSAKLTPYFPPSSADSTAAPSSVLHHFHNLLTQYVRRQTQDDNFTIRVLDRRSNETLELYELADLRAEYRRGNISDWEAVDQHRRTAMERLVDEHEQAGVPLDDIIVRWGRANQVETAHERSRPYQAYERRLAEYLGLSLLATEIGTVETFNQDHLVSAAGARSRYQMLPWILRRSGVTKYSLPTEGGDWIQVREERHPLLVLEPAFLLLKGYVNAVGHEIPGLSAYHTGPGNVFKLYRQYYTASDHFADSSTVADAYAWAVTKGYDIVSDGSTFGSHSRGYVPAAHGALVARNDQPVNRTPSRRAARLQIAPGASITLRELLAPIDSVSPSRRLSGWGPRADSGSTYDRFRALNPHFDLPSTDDGGIPDAGNVRLTSDVKGRAVRFFLPLGAPSVLRDAGIDAIDSTSTFRYDASTYAGPSPAQVTRWDRRYRALIDDIEDFGFTPEHRDRLLRLHDRFESLAERRPTRYRRRQLRIISTHRRLWMSGPWEDLADATEQAMGRMKLEGRPLDELPTDTLLPRSLRTETGIP